MCFLVILSPHMEISRLKLIENFLNINNKVCLLFYFITVDILSDV